MMNTVDDILQALNLTPHPEGGYFRETFRAAVTVDRRTEKSIRCSSTAIYFMLTAGSFSAFHAVNHADEVWHFYDGDPVELHLLSPDSGHQTRILGRDLSAGQRPQIVVPAGTYQAAMTLGDRFSLCGCTVAPGFEYENFAMPTRTDLLELFPECEEVIQRFTRKKIWTRN